MEDGKGNTFLFTKLPTSQYRPEEPRDPLDQTRYIVRCVVCQPAISPSALLIILIALLFSICFVLVLSFIHRTEVSLPSVPRSSSHPTGIPTQPNTSASSSAPSPLPFPVKQGLSHLRMESSRCPRERSIRCWSQTMFMPSMGRGRRERRRRRRSRGC